MMSFQNNNKIKFILVFLIFFQLFYIANKRLAFKTEIFKNSFLKDFGSEYVMTKDILELKEITKNLKLELKKLIRNSLGAIVIISNISFVQMIPKTRSGKIMRRLVSAVLSKSDLGDYSTIEDEASLDEIKKAVIELEKNLKL